MSHHEYGFLRYLASLASVRDKSTSNDTEQEQVRKEKREWFQSLKKDGNHEQLQKSHHSRLEAIASSNKGIATRSKKLLVAPGHTTSNKNATKSKGITTGNTGHYY